MDTLDRRTALKYGLLSTAALAASGKAAAQDTPEQSEQSEIGILDPVLFWNAVSLDMVALDHTIADDMRAIGPCASAYALALIHVALADSIAIAYADDIPAGEKFQPRLVDATAAPSITNREAFVGGLVAAVIAHIYNAPAHLSLLATRQQEYVAELGLANMTDWDAGRSLSSAVSGKWDHGEVLGRLLPAARERDYFPSGHNHHVDPFNPGQGFYGERWGEQAPLVVPKSEDVTDKNYGGLGPGTPPSENDRRYIDDFRQVKALGERDSAERTQDQTEIGLFWAYDGAPLLGTPPRLYNQIVRRVVIADGLSVPAMARVFALCNLAMADAGIVAWRAKYGHRIWRPVVGVRHGIAAEPAKPDWEPLGAPRTNHRDRMIQALQADVQPTAEGLLGARATINQLSFGLGTSGVTAQDFLGARADLGASLPSLRALRVLSGAAEATREAATEEARHPHQVAAFTPNFPAYPSGHATFGSACFNTLIKARLENESIQLSFVSDELDGLSVDNYTDTMRPRKEREYTSIKQMIRENNDSRVFLGVHWAFDATDGEKSGESIAAIAADAYPLS